MVHPSGIEPETFRVGGEYSIRLNYGCIFNFCVLFLQKNTVDFYIAISLYIITDKLKTVNVFCRLQFLFL